jgi:hypothetical protein
VPNAAHSWRGVHSDHSTAPRVGAPDRAACAPLPACRPSAEVGPVPNAAHTSTGVIDMMPTTYSRPVGVSWRSTDASVAAIDRADRVAEPTAQSAIAHAVSASTAAIAVIAASGRYRRRPTAPGMAVEMDISPLRRGGLNEHGWDDPIDLARRLLPGQRRVGASSKS